MRFCLDPLSKKNLQWQQRKINPLLVSFRIQLTTIYEKSPSFKVVAFAVFAFLHMVNIAQLFLRMVDPV